MTNKTERKKEIEKIITEWWDDKNVGIPLNGISVLAQALVDSGRIKEPLDMDYVNEVRGFIQEWAEENKCLWKEQDHLVNTPIFNLAKAICNRFGKPDLDEVLREFSKDYAEYWNGTNISYPEFNHHNSIAWFKSWLSTKLGGK